MCKHSEKEKLVCRKPFYTIRCHHCTQKVMECVWNKDSQCLDCMVAKEESISFDFYVREREKYIAVGTESESSW